MTVNEHQNTRINRFAGASPMQTQLPAIADENYRDSLQVSTQSTWPIENVAARARFISVSSPTQRYDSIRPAHARHDLAADKIVAQVSRMLRLVNQFGPE